MCIYYLAIFQIGKYVDQSLLDDFTNRQVRGSVVLVCVFIYLFVRICSPRSPGRNFRRIVIKFGYVVHINNISVKFVNGHSRSKVIDAMTSSMANSIIAIDSLIIIRIFSNSQDKRTSMLSNVMPNGAHFR